MTKTLKFGYFLLLGSLAFSCFRLVTLASEPPTIEIKAQSPGLTRNDNGQVFIASGPDVNYSTTQVSETKHQLFCEANLFTLNIERRIEDTDAETVIIFNISSQLNGEKIDFFQGKGAPASLNDYTVVDADMSCVEGDWIIYLTGYSSSVTQNGSTLAKLEIDATSGRIK